MFLGAAGMAQAQGSSSGQTRERPGDYSDKKDPIKGHTGEGYGGSNPTTPDEAKRAQTKPTDYSDKADPIKGHTGEYPASSGEKGKERSGQPRSQKDKYYGMPKDKEEKDMGYVDQKKRVERGSDARSPSPDSHVPDFPKDKKGRPMKDLKEEQGGPIGPN
jgi:hypothetical protein